jgi:hypothetical protein
VTSEKAALNWTRREPLGLEADVEAGVSLDALTPFGLPCQLKRAPPLHLNRELRDILGDRRPKNRRVDAVIDVGNEDPVGANVVPRNVGHSRSHLVGQVPGVEQVPDDRWPNSANPYFFIQYLNALTTSPVSRNWVNRRLGIAAQAIRQDRIIDETIATGGDVRRICDFFGVTVNTAVHYSEVLDHPGLREDQTRPART